MARGRKARMTKAAKYAAIGAITELLDPLTKDEAHPGVVIASAESLAKHLVDKAWDVEDFPSARRVTITLDLAELDQPGTEAN